MRRLSKEFLCRCVVLCSMLALHAGCSNQTSVQSFTPHEDLAFEALNEALTAWQNGQAKPGAHEVRTGNDDNQHEITKRVSDADRRARRFGHERRQRGCLGWSCGETQRQD